MIQDIATIANDCGSVASLLAMCIAAEAFVIKILWDQNKKDDLEMQEIYNTLLEVVKNNTEVITKLIDRIDNTHD